MLVEKADIEKAKSKLGDKNAHIMADLLELENFDEKNLKACCPYHSEDTPSFIYNKKNYTYHCFGCNKTIDILDVLMEKGATFLDATKFLFEKADIDYSFGEKDVQTKQNYKYPHEEPLNERVKVFEYLGKRGISKNVVDYLDIREDINGNAVFNFYDTNDVLTMVKYRPSYSVQKPNTKTWCQKNSDTSPLLFNMNRVNTSKPLVICEGEIDCASVVEAGYFNVVSVPLGAGNLHWIEENWDWLDQFSSIIIWSDNDEPGIKMRKECIYRLGTWRTKYIETPAYYVKDNGSKIPIKDANECLQVGGKEYVMKLISDAKDVPVKSVVNFADVEDTDTSDWEGITTGIEPFDKELDKLYYGTLTICTGRPGSGKTSIMDQMIGHTMDEGNSVFLYSKELPEAMTSNWMHSILAGRRNIVKKTSKEGREFYVVPYDIKNKIKQYYNANLYIYRDEESNEVDDLMHSMEESVRKFGCKFVVLDNLMMIDLDCTETEQNNAQKVFINRLIKFSVKFNVAILLVAHPRKTQDNSSEVGMYDIAGSSTIINLAMRSFGMRRISKKEKEDSRSKWGKYDVELNIIKDRIFGRSDISMGLWYDNISRRFYTNYDEFDYQYKWDDKKYTNRLQYVDRLSQQETNPFD